MRAITLQELQKLSPERRRDFRDNNSNNLNNPKFGDIPRQNLELLKESGLAIAPDRELRDGDWQLRKIEMIINSAANEGLMLDAVARGEPPLGAIEHLIRETLGNEYRSDRKDTVHAGDLVAKRLYALNYEKVVGGEQRMPTGSVAKTAATFRKRKR